MITKSGLIGAYQPPIMNKNHTNSIYMLGDETTQSLFVFILYPGSYDDIYKIASLTWYRNIILVPISVTSYFISDIVRLCEDLSNISKNVKILTPDRFPQYVPTTTEMCLIKGQKTILSFDKGFVAFDYKMSDNVYERGFHDIYLSFKGRRFLFCPLEVNEERVYGMLTNNLVDYVYVPYNDPMFGTLSYLSIVQSKTFEGMDRQFIAMGFRNQTAANFCRMHYPYSYPMTYRYAFANSIIGITDTCDKLTVGEGALDHANNTYILNNQTPDDTTESINSNDETASSYNPCTQVCACTECPHKPDAQPEIPPRPEKFIPPTVERANHPFDMPEIDGTITIPDEPSSNDTTPDETVDDTTSEEVIEEENS